MLSFFGACSAYTSHLKKIQIKQNHVIRVLFFATLYGKNTKSVLNPLMNLLDILTVEIFLHCNFLNSPISGIESSSQVYLMNIFNMPVMSILTMPLCRKRQLL